MGVTCVALSALAQQPDPVGVLADELKSKMPPKWEAHVRWRERDQLLATIIPWPYQEAFALWYDQSKLASTLAARKRPLTATAMGAWRRGANI
jgi:hypothetical protein